MDGGLDQEKINAVPADLQVDTNQRSVVSTTSVPLAGGEVVSGATASMSAASKVAVPLITHHRTQAKWVWLVWIILGIGLIGATIYFVLTQINFNRGKINFIFEPAGVSVSIDQKFSQSGVANLSINLKTGDHIIVVTKEGYLDAEEEFSVAIGEASDMTIVLDPIPTAELLAETVSVFPALLRRDELLAFWDDAHKSIKAINLSTKELVDLFSAEITNVQKIDWSNEGVAALLKLPGVWKLSNMQDNRAVPGQYIPLGESPQQAPALNNGVATWLFD
ncbi:PEGA domain-containing protein, partial [Patescibacteria group bacterium]|nr:PEGA domain-containing protein [Patescibacteria group bacterium]